MGVQIRVATPSDLKAVQELLADSEARLVRSDADLTAQLNSGVTILASDRARLVAAVGCATQNPAVAYLTSFAVARPWTAGAALALLLPRLEGLLLQRHTRLLVYTAVEPWLVPTLLVRGFSISTRVVSYQLDSLIAPDPAPTLAQIGPAGPDLRPVVRIDRESFPLEWHYGQRIVDQAYRIAEHFRLARWEGEPVGYAYGTMHGDGGHLTRIAVLPEFRGRGIGGALLSDTIRGFAQKGAWWMTLNTQEENLPAQRIYQALGFHRLGMPVPFLCLKLVRSRKGAGLST